MIVYLASYPRSGSALMQSLVSQGFQHPPTSLYRHNVPAVPTKLTWATNWRVGKDIPLHLRLMRPWLLWNEWIALYDLNVPPYTKNNRYLTSGTRNVLKKQMRLRLSLEKTVYFIKTHEMPFKRYLKGERVVQIVRHPGPVMRSYYNLKANNPKSNIHYTADEIIEGKVRYKTWSEYHQRWHQAAEEMGDQYERVYFEEVTQNPLVFYEAVHRLTGLPYTMPENQVRFEDLKSRSKVYYAFGSNKDWEKHFTPEQVARIYALNTPMMRKLRYLDAEAPEQTPDS